ncbi:peptidylprolyl isomerase [Thalassomonas sp. M1454]|uniref:peptidylprolyl isomerase n=1 Tax=Thalassomonas sp. M1454 TaxID=2594477 RepID=UPI00118041FE|nr:peptidylprolyl isomerase [Thalassomonas sp. M1454]TRX54969.1 peptidylprolyl isomerase [Thalassomonas sp. M1454]
MKFLNISFSSLLLSSLLALSSSANATVVLFKTNMGDFEVNLFDQETPETVDNFLRYIETGAYKNSIVHRSVKNFIVQGGGFSYNIDNNNIVDEMKFTAVMNEPKFSNVRGTIAMAKLGNNPDSATNQWFFNVADNGANLDNQNEGFTAFGRVTGDGMEVVDAINQLDLYNITDLPAFTDTPLRTEPSGDGINEQHFVLIESITVIDANEDTQPNLPPKSTAEPTSESGGSSGGTVFWLLSILSLGLFRRSVKS